MKLVVLSLLISLPVFGANKQSWVPKYEKEHLSKLQTKIKPAKNKLNILSDIFNSTNIKT